MAIERHFKRNEHEMLTVIQRGPSLSRPSLASEVLLYVSTFLGIDEVDVLINEAKTQSKDVVIGPTTLEEFKTIFKYLAFVACAAKAPVRQKMLDETLASISKAGTAENIERWCWWTPDQLSLLEQAENLNRVILIGKAIRIVHTFLQAIFT